VDHNELASLPGVARQGIFHAFINDTATAARSLHPVHGTDGHISNKSGTIVGDGVEANLADGDWISNIPDNACPAFGMALETSRLNGTPAKARATIFRKCIATELQGHVLLLHRVVIKLRVTPCLVEAQHAIPFDEWRFRNLAYVRGDVIATLWNADGMHGQLHLVRRIKIVHDFTLVLFSDTSKALPLTQRCARLRFNTTPEPPRCCWRNGLLPINVFRAAIVQTVVSCAFTATLAHHTWTGEIARIEENFGRMAKWPKILLGHTFLMLVFWCVEMHARVLTVAHRAIQGHGTCRSDPSRA
jgi:hypothetical protein